MVGDVRKVVTGSALGLCYLLIHRRCDLQVPNSNSDYAESIDVDYTGAQLKGRPRRAKLAHFYAKRIWR